MKFTINASLIISIFFVFLIFTPLSFANALESKTGVTHSSKVWIPEEEFLSYFDSNGIYTVVGNVKNENNFAVIPTISVSVKDDDIMYSNTIQHVPLAAGKEIPFKIKFPEVIGNTPILMPSKMTFDKTEKEPISIEVFYDKTLIIHEDGHITGKIQNTGDKTIHYPKVFAVVHGYEKVLDIVQNMNFIEKIGPGEVVDFSMYPDPSITSDIYYYSCFAVTDSFVRPVYTERNGEKFYFRYDSGSWYTAPQFNEKGTELTMRTQNSFPIGTYANFEFPSFSEDEKFSVFVNNELKKNIQSIDEMKNWHVAFNVEPLESGEIKITGFKEGYDPGDAVLIPDWIKFSAAWWADKEIDNDVFVRGIDFMIKEKIIIVSGTSDEIQNRELIIPEWFRNNALWWSQDNINNETFAKGLEYLINHGIVQV
ncbi:MAG: peptidase [Nitrosopumilus sp.]|nr:peptidase [Nitrosopumilus sp.]MDH3823379.1 peptidase [Nitrosopumilus sp.]MDH3834733.1 peptidase [Nitrosopumilus sp.]